MSSGGSSYVKSSLSNLPFSIREEYFSVGDAQAHLDNYPPDFFENESAYGFFSREFFPEPNCETAIAHGQEIFDGLVEDYDDQLVRDYFRLNYLFCYAIGDSLRRGDGGERPSVGDFGVEHVYFYLPLGVAKTLERYS